MSKVVSRVPRLLQVVGINSVPLVGIFAADWTDATALAFYWCENVIVTVLVSFRIWLHRRATRLAGHWETSPVAAADAASSTSTFLSGFLVPASAFTAGHAVFLGLLLFVILPQSFPDAGGVDLASLGEGVAAGTLVLTVGCSIDAVRIRHRPFSWIRQLAQRVLGRVVLVHLTIIFGMFAMTWLDGPRGLFLVFAGFKTLADLGSYLGSDAAPDPEPSHWLVWSIRLLAGKRRAEAFVEFHRTSVAAELRRAAEWEQPVPAGR
jgi:hypothetical protein